MLFERFLIAFPPESDDVFGRIVGGGPGLEHLIQAGGGCAFGGGIYRLLTSTASVEARANALEAFPDYAGRIGVCFGSDWLGRIFSLDLSRGVDSNSEILMLDVGAGDAFEVPVQFSDFHDGELVEHSNDALASEYYREWLAAGNAVPKPSECVGYRVPLFLGGLDEVANLELTSMDVYWSITGQIRAQTLTSKPGARIGKVKKKRGPIRK